MTAGTTYVVSYFAPNGHYSADLGYFNTGAVNTPLRSVAQGGVYLYGNGFPSSSYLNSNYYVDVVFTTTDDDPPVVTTTTPAAGATGVVTDVPVTATFAAAVSSATVTLTLTDPTGQLVGGQLTYDAATRTATFATAAPLLAGTVYRGTAEATSASGVAMTAPKTWTFTTADSAPPAVTTVSPADGASGVAGGARVTATFERPVDPAGTAIQLLERTSGNAVAGTTSYDSTTRTATFTPTAPLADLTGYTASVTARAPSGATMPAPRTWQFTTRDSTPPSVTATTPAPGATAVVVGTSVTAAFARSVDPATLQVGLKSGAGTAVPGTTTYDAATRVATFRPAAALSGATTFTATATASNTSGVPMASPPPGRSPPRTSTLRS